MSESPRRTDARRRAFRASDPIVIGGGFASAFCAFCLILRFAIGDRAYWWGWVGALLPAMLVLEHAAFLVLSRRRVLLDSEARDAGARKRDVEREMLRDALAAARDTHERHFQPALIGIRYGAAAFLIFFTALTSFYLLYEASGPFGRVLADYPSLRTGARYGAAGAYVYVLSSLGRRRFRHDVTSGAAMWSAVTLALGPVVAGVLALLWRGVAAAPQGVPADGLASEVVFFSAGLSTRWVVSRLEDAARRQWAPSVTSVPRLLPLNQIRGVTPAIEERLNEEGIEDVAGLAAADPLRLLRSTSYDLRQIVGWIDEAILITTLPEHWQALERLGITGAIDLAWYELREAEVTRDR